MKLIRVGLNSSLCRGVGVSDTCEIHLDNAGYAHVMHAELLPRPRQPIQAHIPNEHRRARLHARI